MRKVILSMVILIFGYIVNAQEVPQQQANPKSKSAQKIAKKKEEREKDQAVGEEKAKKRHMKIQTKETRKRMKKSARRAKRFNDRKEGGFFRRLFSSGKKRP